MLHYSGHKIPFKTIKFPFLVAKPYRNKKPVQVRQEVLLCSKAAFGGPGEGMEIRLLGILLSRK
jgi:hypothetical protein